MSSMTRWLWRRLPESWRHQLFQRVMKSPNPLVRAAITVAIKVSLLNHRSAVSAMFPESRGSEYGALIAWSLFLRFHDRALDTMWRFGHLARRRITPRPSQPHHRSVVHATGSFDLGGTQTQIRNLCTISGTRYQHAAVEIFPELNFLYRRGETIDEARYVQGVWWERALGRLVLNRNYRSSQLVQVYKLYRDFRALDANVAVGWGHEMCVTAFIAAAFARVPHIVFCIRTVNPHYGWVLPPFPSLLLNAHRRMLPMVSKVVVNSTLLQRDHAAWVGMPAEAIAVCPNGITISPLAAEVAAAARTSLRAAHGIGPDTIVILNIGRFSHEKGQVWMVEANQLLRQRGTAPPYVMVMCGDGPTLADVRGRVEGYDMTNVVFPGRTDRVREWLSAADIFVMPSDFEGMPNAMMEAMAVGLPCVSTTNSGALDVARPGREALYYQPRQPLPLAQHLEHLMQDRAAARALGRAAAARIEEFSVSRFVADFERVLDSLRPSPPPS